MANRLAQETSPYLLQHQDNPVDWYPWSEEAFSRARAKDRPILLSVGYSSCHWCHVMEHESFEDPDTARVMNDWFIPVKVDREERPDVDAVYMEAVQASTGRGGWPMTVFLTPEGVPLFAGTYFPKEARQGMPSFRDVLEAVHDAWSRRREQVLEQGHRLADAIGRAIPPVADVPGPETLGAAYDQIEQSFDPVNGGFGHAPKFPQEPVLEFLLRAHDQTWAPGALHMLETTLEKMAHGGIYDQLGGGFARYATDNQWLIPHFEKMLYNNAQLARIYVRAWQVTGNSEFARVGQETIDYVLADLTNGHGGFMAAEDADSEGVEGKFYVWTPQEVAAALAGMSERADEVAARAFRLRGDVEGAAVLTRAASPAEIAAEFGLETAAAESQLGRIRAELRTVRDQRVRPGLDDKVIVAWNGLMVRALAEAGSVMGRPEYVEAARRNARFVLDHVRRPDGRLLRSWSKGRADILGYLEDYAAYALGLSALYEATGEIEWFRAARDLTEAIPDLFEHDGSLFATGRDGESLIVRPRDLMDNPAPSGASMAAEAFLRLGLYTGDSSWLDRFERSVLAAGRLIERAPSAVAHLLAILTSYVVGPRELAIVGAAAQSMSSVVWEEYRPHLLVSIDRAGSDGHEVPLLAGRHRPGETLAYLCERMTCAAPVSDAQSLRAALAAT